MFRDWLRFLRAPLAPTAAWDSVAATGLALTAADRGIADVTPGAWAALAGTSLLLYAFGMGLNDLADRERDRQLAPDRPLPSGAVPVGGATALVVLLGVGALALGGGPAGSRLAVAGTILAAMLYDLWLKRWVAPGAMAMGAVRALNASIGVVPLVASGAAPATVLLAPLCVGLYAAAITVWSTTEETESRARRLVARILAVLGFAGAGLLPFVFAGRLTLGVLVAGGVVSSLAFARTPKPGPPKRQVLEMLLGLYFLSYCIASGADGGSMRASLGGLGIAFALIFLSQVAIRSLRPRPPVLPEA